MGGVRAVTWAFAAVLSSLGTGCGGMDPLVQEVTGNVVTFQRGTVSGLRDLRGTGPFRPYDVPPDEMLGILERAVAKGGPRVAVFVSENYGEVVGRETADGASGYDEPFLSAVVVTVHPLADRPRACRVEFHATNRGPFHRGSIRWERDLWRFIEEARCEEAQRRGGPKPIR